MVTALQTFDASAREDVVDSPAAWATIAFLGLVAGTQMVDRGLLAMLSPAIQTSFQVNDSAMGALLGIAGILVASMVAVPLARLADRKSRKLILFGYVAAWSGLTFLAALAPNFALFFLGRAAAGITEFALIPVIYSMIPDLVSERSRVLGNLVFAAIMAAGASAGWFFSSAILDLAVRAAAAFPSVFSGVETWRIAMLILATFGLPIIVIGLATIDPPRMRTTTEAAEGGSLLAFARRQSTVLIALIVAAGGAAIAVQGMTQMIILALSRRFPTADFGGIGQMIGLLMLVTTFVSLALAGTLDRILLPRFAQMSRPLIMAAGAALAAPCVAIMLSASSPEMIMILLGGFLLTTGVASTFIPTIIQDIVPNVIRARAFAVYSLIISIFCASGPVIVGALSDDLLGHDLLAAIVVAGVPSLLGAAACAAIAARLYPRQA